MSETRAEKKEAILEFIKGEVTKLSGFPVEWWISHKLTGDNWNKAQKIMTDWWKAYGKKG